MYLSCKSITVKLNFLNILGFLFCVHKSFSNQMMYSSPFIRTIAFTLSCPNTLTVGKTRIFCLSAHVSNYISSDNKDQNNHKTKKNTKTKIYASYEITSH